MIGCTRYGGEVRSGQHVRADVGARFLDEEDVRSYCSRAPRRLEGDGDSAVLCHEHAWAESFLEEGHLITVRERLATMLLFVYRRVTITK